MNLIFTIWFFKNQVHINTLFHNLPFTSDYNLECDTVYLCLTKSLLVPFPPPILQLLLTQPVSGCISCCTSACLWLGFCVSNFLSREKLTQKWRAKSWAIYKNFNSWLMNLNQTPSAKWLFLYRHSSIYAVNVGTHTQNAEAKTV